MAGAGFRRLRDFTLSTFIGHNLLLVYYRRFEYKGNFCEYGLYYTWVQMLLQIGPLLRLGSNVITDGTFTWFQLLHLYLLQGLLHVFVSPLLLPAFKNRFKFFWPGIIVW